MNTLILSQIDICLPDYFGGHSLPVVQIPVHKDMTFREVKESLLDIEMSIGHLEEIDEDEYISAVHVLFEYVHLDDIVKATRDIEEEQYEYCGSVYMFFVLEENDGEDL